MKAVQFNDYEAFRIGMNIEKDGIEFYTEFANNTKSPETKNIMLKLAEDEKEHLDLLEQLSREVESRYEGQAISGDELIDKYLKSIVETGVFYDPKNLPAGSIKNLTDKEVLSIGIQTEKDSILFYEEAARLSTNPSGKKAFERLVAEEKNHLVILKGRLEKIGYGS